MDSVLWMCLFLNVPLNLLKMHLAPAYCFQKEFPSFFERAIVYKLHGIRIKI